MPALSVDAQLPIEAMAWPGVDVRGEPGVAVAMKASFVLGDEGDTLSVATEPTPLEMSDQFAGEAPRALLIAAGELVPFKQGCDLLMTGAIQITPGQSVAQVDVALRRSDGEAFWRKRVWAVGPRATGRMGGLGEPTPLEEPVPLTYERAYGGPTSGFEKSELFACNPAGCGHRPYGWVERSEPNPLIVWPYFGHHENGRTPPGFGPVAPSWEPRSGRFGRLDPEAALLGETRYRKLPKPNAHNVAPDDQQLSEPLRGDEWLELTGVVPGVPPTEPVRWQLPGLSPHLIVRDRTRAQTLAPALDTLHIEPDRGRVNAVWRSWLPETVANNATSLQVDFPLTGSHEHG